jgi:hypothetical protein
MVALGRIWCPGGVELPLREDSLSANVHALGKRCANRDFIWEKIDMILPRSVFVENIVFPSKENVIFPWGSLGMWKLLRMG